MVRFRPHKWLHQMPKAYRDAYLKERTLQTFRSNLLRLQVHQ